MFEAMAKVIDRKCFMLIHMITLTHRDNHGKMPNLWKRCKNRKENLEDGRKTRQERKKNTTHHRALRVLR